MNNIYRISIIAALFTGNMYAAEPSDRLAVLNQLNAQFDALKNAFDTTCVVERPYEGDQETYTLKNHLHCQAIMAAIGDVNGRLEKQYGIRRHDLLLTPKSFEAWTAYTKATGSKK